MLAKDNGNSLPRGGTKKYHPPYPPTFCPGKNPLKCWQTSAQILATLGHRPIVMFSLGTRQRYNAKLSGRPGKEKKEGRPLFGRPESLAGSPAGSGPDRSGPDRTSNPLTNLFKNLKIKMLR